MKTYSILPVILLIVLILVSKATQANDGKYEQAMKKNIESIYGAKSIEEYQSVINNFERIAVAEKDKWEPHYYAGFGYIMMATKEKDKAKQDGYLDQAMRSIEAAKKLVPNESEVVALEGFVNMIRVSVDPGSRGPQYVPVAMQLFGKAIGLNPENPRALALLGQMQLGTAQFFGSSTNEACETNSKALAKFDTYQSTNPLAPQWGRGMAESMKEKCK